MANLKNYIETVVRLNTSKAKKSADELFSKMKSGSKSSATELKKVDSGLKKVGTSATTAGQKFFRTILGAGGAGTVEREKRGTVQFCLTFLGAGGAGPGKRKRNKQF